MSAGRLFLIKIGCASYSAALDARKGYALALRKKVVPSGSVGDALRTRGHYAFDDPMFREWFSKAMSL
jgi:hypothetical protein